jgi:signal transduction histidine kinase
VKSSDFPYLADWFAISYRWLVLIGLAVTLARAHRLDGLTLPALILPVLWNLVMSVLGVFNRRLTAHRLINVGADVLCAALIFSAGGDMRGPVLWAGVLTIAPASIFYEFRGASAAAILISLFEASFLYFFQPALFFNTALAALGAINLATALTFGLLSRPLIRQLRTTYAGLVTKRRETEQQIQTRERERMKALSDMVATFSATLNYKTALEEALNTSVSTMGLSDSEASQLVCAFLLFENSSLRFTVGRGFTAHDQNMPMPAQAGLLNDVLNTGQHRLKVMQTCDDPELCKLVALHNCKSILVMPLIRGMNAYGVLIYAHTDSAFFNDDRTDLLLTISNQAVIAIQNARLYQDLAAEKELLVQSQEEVQKKLARDLHDGPTQSVSAIAMRISIARKLFERSPQAGMEELVKIEELARRTTSEIRHMLFTLRPLVLETEGLLAALNTMAVKIRATFQQNVVIDVNPAVVNALDVSHQTVIFYLVEEAVNNARKHAQASKITVRLQYITNDSSMIGLEVSDNGVGFNVNEVMGSYEQRDSLGMINLRERADLINGLLRIDSAPGKGTRIRVYIPLTDAAADRLNGAR